MAKSSFLSSLDKAGKYIDKGFDRSDPQLTDRAFAALDKLAARETIRDEDAVLLHYFRANAFNNRQHEAGQARSWQWEIEHLQSELLELRKAVRHKGFEKLDPIRCCQIMTNLGSKLNLVGRPVEALYYWDKALAIDRRFAMALFNKGLGLLSYADSVSDLGHSQLIAAQAHNNFVAGTATDAVHESAQNAALVPHFTERAKHISDRLNVASANENLAEKHSLGRTNAEKAYRRWCLEKRLFLNPMNDLGTYSIAATDSLVLPSIALPLDKTGAMPPAVFGLFNQLKQEFTTARLFLFEGMTADTAHFADKGVKLANTLDYPSYGVNVEKARQAYRMTYAVFDKIAFFLNQYFELGIPENKVFFRSIWYETKGTPKSLRSSFSDRENWPLRGLFWLSKDLHDPEFRATTEPDAEALADLRHHLEHKYCQIHEQWAGTFDNLDDTETARIGLHIGRHDFEAKALRLMGLARAATIYLCLAVHREESLKKDGSDEAISMPMLVDTWQDKWKV
ncbi:LA2681 family HEPN domain-containing protein (plasmid) [Agrobacterium sp. rho-13.3]|uniref:LA2681 family HEPN domain-containing protein n=1 Tax=Agrobacterium sp. rho-13.3 TaxID=3072980 RepID=UPI000DDF2AA3|nr:LA2681 family HEPN domain-containing protein [Agrobacterium sp. rho-13.3]MDX8310313.1 LA2681 family HEPN domain-containing protein [Agrobacterium sp. rho-13.3]